MSGNGNKRDDPSRARKKNKTPAKAGETRSERQPPQRPLVVGIGASAGGLEAFKRFFEHMPAASGMAFVLVQHLDPSHHSMLVELLGRHTAMPVEEARDGVAVAANHVYTIPPGAMLTIENGRLKTGKRSPGHTERRQVDTFFSSLARDQGEYAVCIVLSGSGSDGTAGLKSIKEHGGFALAQAGLDEGVGSGMPASAAATGLVDFRIPIEAMPSKLADYARHLAEVAPHKDADGNRRDAAGHLEAITDALHEGIGHDFAQYKKNTLIRRVQRRMQVLQVDGMDAYVDRLRADSDEQRRLFNDLLIGVTQFFRDPAAWQALEETVLPQLFDREPAGEDLRIWVAGCGAGDEVYSMAILLAEALESRDSAREVHIFGTDIDESAIETARAGRYVKPPPGLSDERRERFFTREEDGAWRPTKTIREMCVFAPHSVIKDPPFSRLDLVSCRNLLIYMDGKLQDRVLRRLHYGLKPGGWLFLGSAEGISGHSSLFKAVDKKHRLFQSRETDAAELPDFEPSIASKPPRHVRRDEESPQRQAGDRIERAARRAMEKYAMPYVVIDAERRILRFSGGPLGRFLEPAAGEASFELFAMLKRPLRRVAREAVNEGFAVGNPVERENLPFRIEGRPGAVSLIVEPFDTDGGDGGETRLAVLAFREVPAGAAATKKSSGAGRQAGDLEHELRVTKAQLNTAIRDLETSNEELRSANEEYQSVNEELQSTNEELETSKEEMQSINEELQTVNAELAHKNEELTRANSDWQNLLESTQIATLFLDRGLNVKNFTPSVRELFHLREGDAGRPLTEIVSRLDYDQLKRDAARVLRELEMVEREVSLRDGETRTYLMRIRPYRTVKDVIDGVVLTFTDITERKRGEEALRQSEARFRAFVTASSDVVFRMSADWNEMRQLESQGFLAETRTRGTRWVDKYIPREDRRRVQAAIDTAIREKELFALEHRVFERDGSIGWAYTRAVPLLDADGTITEWFGTASDITARKRGEAEIERLAALVRASHDAIIDHSLEGEILSWNPAAERIFGYSETEAVGQPMTMLIPEKQADEVPALLKRLQRGEPVDKYDVVRETQGGRRIDVELTISPVVDEEGRMAAASTVARDISARLEEVRHRELLMHELSHRVKNTLATVRSLMMQSRHGAEDMDEFTRRFGARIGALSDTHNLLTRSHWQGAGLRELVDTELAPYMRDDHPQWTLEGPAVELVPNAAISLGMAFHELATNAAKYGALSAPEGRIQVHWQREGEGEAQWLRLDWTERGGPPVEDPRRQGFGLRLIRDGLAHELEAEVELAFAEAGLNCSIRFPLAVNAGVRP